LKLEGKLRGLIFETADGFNNRQKNSEEKVYEKVDDGLDGRFDVDGRDRLGAKGAGTSVGLEDRQCGRGGGHPVPGIPRKD